jgi:hypothetical protein
MKALFLAALAIPLAFAVASADEVVVRPPVVVEHQHDYVAPHEERHVFVVPEHREEHHDTTTIIHRDVPPEVYHQ